MHRNISWKFRRMAQVNMYLPLVQREKLLIPTHKRHLKMVCVANFIQVSVTLVNLWITLLLFAFYQLLLYPKLRGHCNLHLLYLNHHTSIGQIHHLWLELQLAVCHCHLGFIMLHHQSVFPEWLKVFFSLNSIFFLNLQLCIYLSEFILWQI